MSVQVVIPQLGESVAEGTLTQWLVKEGDRIERDQSIGIVSTDKADAEIPSPAAGVVKRLLARKDQTLPVGSPIAEIEEAAPTPIAPGPAPSPAPRPGPLPSTVGMRLRASPLVRRMAREHGLDLEQIPGSGAGGRVTKEDLLAFIAGRGPELRARLRPEEEPMRPPPAAPAITARPPPAPAPTAQREIVAPAPAETLYRPPPYVESPGDRLVRFTRRRRLIAEHMVYSKRSAAHVTCVNEVDLGAVEQARRSMPEKPSYLAFVAREMVAAARENPIVNAQVLEDGYVLRGKLHLGIAMDTEEGLLVPVIHDADRYSVVGLSQKIADLAEKARGRRLSPDELSGGTITLSNPGPRGNLWGTPIINQPQVAIVRMGEIQKRPVVVSLDGTDAIAIRPCMFIALTYDHRIIDGVAGNGFLRRIKERLEGLGAVSA